MAICYNFLPLFLIILLGRDSESKKTAHKPKLNILPGHLLARVDYYRNCEDTAPLDLVVTHSRIRNLPSKTIVVDADFNLTRTITQITEVVAIFYNCEDRASGKCPLFQTWRYDTHVCSLVGLENQLWSPITNNMTPRIKCPLYPGQYLLRNGTVDMRIMQALPFPLEQYYWRVRVEAYDPQLYYCGVVGVQYLRSHHL